jgi:hypothetical protein
METGMRKSRDGEINKTRGFVRLGLRIKCTCKVEECLFCSWEQTAVTEMTELGGNLLNIILILEYGVLGRICTARHLGGRA